MYRQSGTGSPLRAVIDRKVRTVVEGQRRSKGLTHRSGRRRCVGNLYRYGEVFCIVGIELCTRQRLVVDRGTARDHRYIVISHRSQLAQAFVITRRGIRQFDLDLITHLQTERAQIILKDRQTAILGTVVIGQHHRTLRYVLRARATISSYITLDRLIGVGRTGNHQLHELLDAQHTRGGRIGLRLRSRLLTAIGGRATTDQFVGRTVRIGLEDIRHRTRLRGSRDITKGFIPLHPLLLVDVEHHVATIALLAEHPLVAQLAIGQIIRLIEGIEVALHGVVFIIAALDRVLTLYRAGSYTPYGSLVACCNDRIVLHSYILHEQVVVRCRQRSLHLTTYRPYQHIVAGVREIERRILTRRGGRRRLLATARALAQVDLRTALTHRQGRVIHTDTTRRSRREADVEVINGILQRHRSRCLHPLGRSTRNSAGRKVHRHPLFAIAREVQHHIARLIDCAVAIQVEGQIQIRLTLQRQLLDRKEVLVGRLIRGEPYVTLTRAGRIGRVLRSYRTSRRVVTSIGRRAGYYTRATHHIGRILICVRPIAIATLHGHTKALIPDSIGHHRIARLVATRITAGCQVNLLTTLAQRKLYVINGKYRNLVYPELHIEFRRCSLQRHIGRSIYPELIGLGRRIVDLRPRCTITAQGDVELLGIEGVVIRTVIVFRVGTTKVELELRLLTRQGDITHHKDRIVRTEEEFTGTRSTGITGTQFTRLAHRNIARRSIVGHRSTYRTTLLPIGVILHQGLILTLVAKVLVPQRITGRRITTARSTALGTLREVDLRTQVVARLELDIIDTEDRSLRSREANVEIIRHLHEREISLGRYPVGTLRVAIILRNVELRPLLAVATDCHLELLQVEYVVVIAIGKRLRIATQEAQIQAILLGLQSDLIDHKAGRSCTKEDHIGTRTGIGQTR